MPRQESRGDVTQKHTRAAYSLGKGKLGNYVGKLALEARRYHVLISGECKMPANANLFTN